MVSLRSATGLVPGSAPEAKRHDTEVARRRDTPITGSSLAWLWGHGSAPGGRWGRIVPRRRGTIAALCDHERVRRPLFALALACLLSGCASDNATVSQTVTAASPQEAAVEWAERTPAQGPALVFHVHRLAVTETGWRAELEIRNETSVAWELGTDPIAVARSFGIMLFATGELAEVDDRGADGDLPGLRSARRFDPRLPDRLEPRERWRGTVAADGALAADRYLRVVFGPLVARSDPPDGLPEQFVWITDHAYELRP